MKLTTFSAVAAASMVLSSAAVWSLAGVGQAAASEPAATSAAWVAPTASVSADPDPIGALLGLGEKDHFDVGGTLRMEGRLGHSTLAAGRSAETFIHVDMTTDAETTAATNVPVNLSIVIDRSGSMQGQRMANALSAARGMIGRLRNGDTVSVVAYNTTSTVVVPPTTLTEGTRTDVSLGLRAIEARGNTCISCGIEAGLDQLSRRTGAVNRLLLLSDGEANVGIRDEEGFRSLAARARGTEATVSSIGVDVDYNERLLLAVSVASNGRHYFVENPGSLPRIFDEEFRTLVETIATGAEVAVELAAGVELVEVFDRTFRQDGNRVTIPMGTFARGDEKSLLMRVRTSRADAGDRDIAKVALRFDDRVEGEPGSCDGELISVVTDDPRKVAALDPIVETRLARAETLAALGEANAQFAAGDPAAAAGLLKKTRTRIRKRKARSQNLAPASARPKVDRDFERQIGALEKAESGFGKAQAANPFDSANSRAGRASVRSNANEFDDLAL